MELTRTVVLESHKLTRRKQTILQDITTQYERVLKYLVRKAVDNRVTSHITLRKTHIDHLKQNYTLKTHYYYEAARQAVQIYKSFKKCKTKKHHPEIQNITLHLDDHLWNPVKITGKTLIISIATPGNRVYIPFKLNKHFTKYFTNGWDLKPTARLKYDAQRGVIHLYLTFQKDFPEPTPGKGVLPVDYNADNVTYGVPTRPVRRETRLARETEKYSRTLQRIQEKYGQSNRGKRLMRKFGARWRNRRKAVIYSLVHEILSTAKKYSLTVVLEDLPKGFNRKVAGKTRSKGLRNKLHNIGFGFFKRVLLDKAVEYGVKVVFVNPAYSSSTCPACNSRVNPGRNRVFRCSSCGFVNDRDVVALFNLEFRGLGVLGLSSEP